MQKSFLVSAIAATALYGCGSAPMQANDPCDPDQGNGYVHSQDNAILLSGSGEMVRSGYWKPVKIDCDATVAVTATTSDTLDLDTVEVVAAEPTVVERIRINTRVLFDFDSALLTDAGAIELDLLISDINAMELINSVLVVGHTDSIGSKSYNQMLSERRAAAVRDYMIDKLGIYNILAEGRGEEEPIASNDTAEGRAQNRRVEVYVDGSAEEAEVNAQIPVIDSVSELIKSLTE